MRLYQGDFKQETRFSDDPVEVAMRWHTLGATRLHVVDLDGAESGELKNLELIKLIAAFSPVQVGGGVRTMEAIESLIKVNVDRVILGTIAVEKPAMV